MIDRLETLAAEWLAAKAIETKAIDDRRAVEDKLNAIFDAPVVGWEGTMEYVLGKYDCRLVQRISRKVDHEMIGVISAEHSLENLLPVVFRWKASVNLKAWNALDPEVCHLFAQAITTKPNRPSFKITEREEP
jgi:hypothetical protein